MRTIPKEQWPEWIKGLLPNRKNVEVKESNGHYYLYKYENVWDKKLKSPRKTVSYLGVLKERWGRIREHGHIAFLMELLFRHRIIKALKKHFPYEWRELILFSLNRLAYPSPLKRMGSWMDKTTLDKYLGIGKIPGKQLSRILAKVGTNTKGQSGFMRELIEDGELLLYDGSVVHSSSEYNKLIEFGYNKGRLSLPKANITLLFSRDRNLPIHFRLFFGSMHEIKTVKAVIEEIKDRDILFIADKGYYKNKLYEDLNASNIRFILPLPRDDRRINYTKPFTQVFEYHKRIIKCNSSYVKPCYLYQFEDQHMKYVETSHYYRKRLAGKEPRFNEHWAGRIALLSNKRLGPKEAYLLWKTRDRIEKAFDVLQNHLETDHPYVSREDVFRGYIFASFISLLAYYLVLNLLKRHDVNDKLSVEDVVFEFSKVMVEDRGYPAFAEIPGSVEELAKKLEVYDIVTKIWES